MTRDTPHVTSLLRPNELLEQLTSFVPGFEAAWWNSLFVGVDGSFTAHGVFSEFSYYVRTHFVEFDVDTWKKLFHSVEQCVLTDLSDSHSQAGVSNAACTCFLENIAGEGQLSHVVSRYLGPESRKYFDHWNG